MRRSPISPPDTFSLSPLLSLLPVKGKIGSLPALTNSLYARYEKVQALLHEFEGDEDSVFIKRLNAEAQMLKQVLDWLTLSPEGTS